MAGSISRFRTTKYHAIRFQQNPVVDISIWDASKATWTDVPTEDIRVRLNQTFIRLENLHRLPDDPMERGTLLLSYLDFKILNQSTMKACFEQIDVKPNRKFNTADASNKSRSVLYFEISGGGDLGLIQKAAIPENAINNTEKGFNALYSVQQTIATALAGYAVDSNSQNPQSTSSPTVWIRLASIGRRTDGDSTLATLKGSKSRFSLIKRENIPEYNDAVRPIQAQGQKTQRKEAVPKPIKMDSSSSYTNLDLTIGAKETSSGVHDMFENTEETMRMLHPLNATSRVLESTLGSPNSIEDDTLKLTEDYLLEIRMQFQEMLQGIDKKLEVVREKRGHL